MKILLIEDDADLLDLTAYTLRRQQWSVIEAPDAPSGLRRWRASRPDVLLVDLGLPGGDGFEVLKTVRATDATPVIVLTGSKKEQDLLRAFAMGADDFVTKPFGPRELIARINAVARRAKQPSGDLAQPTLEIGDLRLDSEAHEVKRRGRAVRLTPTEFRIFNLLATNAGRVVTNSRMLSFVWGSDGGDASALRAHVSHIRTKLELTRPENGTITGIPTVGYCFRPPAQIPAAGERRKTERRTGAAVS